MLILWVGIVLANGGIKNANIKGKVLASENNAPIEHAQLVLEGSQYIAFSNEDGEYLFENVASGNYTLSVLYVGLKKASQNIELGEEDLEVNIYVDSLIKKLKEVTVREMKDNNFGITHLRNIEGTAIYAGKKSEVVLMGEVAGNLATNNSRQIYNKVAGLNIWESDAAGIQLGIGGRGLSPNRTSNFNTRQNGYDMSADALGYPESYYSPPAEAIERIEVVRGAASLQYGTQFGGMINFQLKHAPENKKIDVNIRQTGGSYGFYNSFTSIGGTVGKFEYYTFYQYKRGNGWRPNSGFDVHTAHSNIAFRPNKKMRIGFEYTFMNYLAQQAGGLTDALFEQDPRQSIRERNWFKVRWNLPAINFDYKISPKTRFNFRAFSLIASRDALGYLGFINRADPLEERNLISSQFKNAGAEARIVQRYKLLGNQSNFLFGARFYTGQTTAQQGFADDGYDANFNYLDTENALTSDYLFPSYNVSLFAENIFAITHNFSITPGLRFEYINTQSDGYYVLRNTDLAGNEILRQEIQDDRKNKRSFVLAGVGVSYKPKGLTEIYANFSQNYRAITFNDMRVVNPNFRIDPNLKDETGYSADLGIRGTFKNWLSYDISGFLLAYKNKIGAVLKVDTALYNVYRYRTNISNARNFGLESFVEIDLFKIWNSKSEHGLSWFSNLTIQNGKYVNSDESAYNGKQVELVPPVIFRTGLSYTFRSFKATYQCSYTKEHFTEATNAVQTATAVNGIIPSYYVMDLALEYKFKKWFTLSGGINNMTNNMYFTRRAEGYPGPGIIPAEGISFYGTLGFNF